ncbi:MAG: YggS family pyridoxal phosphate-dependent enzyme [Phycisphaerales bacterium]
MTASTNTGVRTPGMTVAGAGMNSGGVGSGGAGMGGDGTLKSRYEAVKERVAAAARRAGRAPSDIVIVAVTKYADPEQVRALAHLGHRDFGESRVQHLIQQAAMMDEFMSRRRIAHTVAAAMGEVEPVRWHMIGHLQRNKARKAVELCRLIHSVDSLRLAEEIQALATRREQPVDVLVQVNCSGEASKHGCPIPAALHLAEQIDTMMQVRVRGLMTMAPLSENPEDARVTFRRCRELFHEIAKTGVSEGKFNILSMGMSSDYEVGIEEGANMVRVGAAIFGEPKHLPGDDADED